MSGLGTQELLIVLVLVVLVFGAGKIPQVGEALGKGVSLFREGVNPAAPDDAKQVKDKVN